MKKAKLRYEKGKDVFLYDTRVANLFINEMLPKAPGEYVKVYLFGLMYAQMEYAIDVETIARDLDMSVSDVEKAFAYWVRMGAIRVELSADRQTYEIEYVRLVQQLYGTKESSSPCAIEESENREIREDSRAASLSDPEIREIFAQYEQATGRLLSPKELSKIADCVNVYGIAPEVISYAIEYCADIEKYNIDYITTVAQRWNENGCRTAAEAKAEVDRHSQKNSFYNKIFKAVGFNRTPSPADREMMDKWFDEWGYTLKEVLEACAKTAGQREPSLKYVNKVLENQILKTGGINTELIAKAVEDENTRPTAKVSKQILKEYFEYLREEAQRRLDARTDEVCASVPEMRGIYQLINETSDEMMACNFMKGAKEKRAELRERMRELDAEKRRLLTKNGYSERYLDIEYKCTKCKDTGTTEDGRICACSALRAEEAFAWMREKSKR